MGRSGKDKEEPFLIGSTGDSLREAFGRALVSLAEKYPRFVVLDADVAGGSGTHHFRKEYPERFYQMGIAEQNMMAAAAGFAATGLVPFVTTFAVFCLRALEQARLSIAYPQSNVKIVASHPGLDAGPDGASAQALEDLAAFRSIPGLVVISPADSTEIFQATEAVLLHRGPVYMRTGRSSAPQILDDTHNFEIGKGCILREGKDVTIIACGVEVARALEAAEMLEQQKVSARIVNMSTIKPIDSELVLKCSMETGCFVTAEDHNIFGGLGGAVAETLAQHKPAPLELVGVRDSFGESGEPDELADKYGLSPRSIVEAALRAVQRKNSR
jgi:transketolase